MPSLFEGLPLTAIESSLSGTPVIINAAPGLEETLPSDWPLKAERNNVDSFCHIFSSMDNYQYSELQKKQVNSQCLIFPYKTCNSHTKKIYYAFSHKHILLKHKISEILIPLIQGDYYLADCPFHSNIGDILIWQGRIGTS